MGDFLGDILEGTEWSDFSQKRLAHYIYMLQSRKATSADISAVWAYLDALRDNNLITGYQKNALLALANRVHENLLKHCEPYVKIPWPEIVETIERIAGGEMKETQNRR
ncbi:MAG: hypothetical protein IJQ31_15010 [Thermoguttaceae bacterium]|nr:hypothetical protein [Thermoguttaceae bacterium]